MTPVSGPGCSARLKSTRSIDVSKGLSLRPIFVSDYPISASTYTYLSPMRYTWHSRAATRCAPPLAQEEQTRCLAAASGSTNSRHIACFLSWYRDEGPRGRAANTAILANMSADHIATKIQIPSKTSNNVSNTLDSVGILVKRDPLSRRPKRCSHLSLDRGGLIDSPLPPAFG